jgi:histidine triad (HIT) family protein
MTGCVFCKIIRKEQPEDIVFEDDNVIAFVPLEQDTKGHVVVAPKEHFRDIFDITPVVLERLMVTAKTLSQRLVRENNATGVNLINNSGADAQQTVFHFHVHIIPRYKDDGLSLWLHTTSPRTF